MEWLGSSQNGWNRIVEKKVKSTHPYGTINFDQGLGEWLAKKHAKDMDMYEEVAWLKRQELAMKEWDRLRQERLTVANIWIGREIERRMHGMFQYGVPDEEASFAPSFATSHATCQPRVWLYQQEWTKKPPPEAMEFYEHLAWLKKQRLAGEAWVGIQEEAAERRRVEEERLVWLERDANSNQPEPEPETRQARWKRVSGGAVGKGTLVGVMAAAAAAKREQSRKLAWGIKASDRYRLATVLRDERPKWCVLRLF